MNMPAKKSKPVKAKKKKAAKPKKAVKQKSPSAVKGLFSVKRHIQEGHILIAACDNELLGKTLDDGNLCIEVRESFYGGEKVGPDILGRLLEMCTMANLVGKRAVGLATQMGIVDEDCVIYIKGVPHAQCLKFL
jgi:hypothetical protein